VGGLESVAGGLAREVVVPLPGPGHVWVLLFAGKIRLHHSAHCRAEGVHVGFRDQIGVEEIKVPGGGKGGAVVAHVKGAPGERHYLGEAAVDQVVVVEHCLPRLERDGDTARHFDSHGCVMFGPAEGGVLFGSVRPVVASGNYPQGVFIHKGQVDLDAVVETFWGEEPVLNFVLWDLDDVAVPAEGVLGADVGRQNGGVIYDEVGPQQRLYRLQNDGMVEGVEDRLGPGLGEQVEVVLAGFLAEVGNLVPQMLEGGGALLSVAGPDFWRNKRIHQDAKVRDLLFSEDVDDEIAFGVEFIFVTGAHWFSWVGGRFVVWCAPIRGPPQGP
jgi:hypothetical protein